MAAPLNTIRKQRLIYIFYFGDKSAKIIQINVYVSKNSKVLDRYI